MLPTNPVEEAVQMLETSSLETKKKVYKVINLTKQVLLWNDFAI